MYDLLKDVDILLQSVHFVAYVFFEACSIRDFEATCGEDSCRRLQKETWRT